MRQISEQEIIAVAPNPTSVNNAKKIVKQNNFLNLSASSDDTFYMGTCKGSSHNLYITSIDFIDPVSPVFRCSCPSRQFPCKHSLALLFAISEKMNFSACDIPDDIQKKRSQKESRAEKKAAKSKTPTKPKKSAIAKKIKKQLEGLKMTEQVIQNLLLSGLGTINGNSLKVYRDLAKQLGDYYLPGPQLYIKRLLLAMEQLQKDSDSAHYEEAISILIRLHSLVKKANSYLNQKLSSEAFDQEDTILYEELGGIWQLDQLQQLGLKKENARLLQLSFCVYLDEARGEYIDLGYWADVDTGEIFSTYNYRPLKALKYVKQENSIFELAHIPMLTYYPGEYNQRVRWEGASYTPVTPEILHSLRMNAPSDLTSVIKQVKNHIKNTLSENYVVLLFHYDKLINTEQGYMIKDPSGVSILTKDRPDFLNTADKLPLLPDISLFEDQVLLGAFFYDPPTKRICLQPLSILTDKAIIRLLY